MRVKQEIRRLGFFWLPSAPNRKVPGTLSILDGGTIELELVEPSGSRRIGTNLKHVKRILGQVETDGPVTLDDCSWKTSKYDRAISKSIFHASRAFLGAAYENGATPRYNTVIFSVEGFDKWVGITGIKVNEEVKNGNVTISYQQPAELSIKLKNNMRLSIGFGWTGPAPATGMLIGEATIGQKAYFKLDVEDSCEFDQFMTICERITKLLCFAMDDIVFLESITATSDNLHESVGNEMTLRKPICIYYQSWPLPKHESTKYRRIALFGFKMIKNDVERKINNWIQAYEKLAPTLDLYFWTQMKDSQFLEVKFLTLVQGLEVCHRRTSNETQMESRDFDRLKQNLLAQCPADNLQWLTDTLKYANELRLRQRIKAIIEPFKDIVGNKKQRSALIHQVVVMRNFLTHRDKDLESEAAKVDLSSLYSKVELIFQLYLLGLIGLNRGEVDAVVKHSIVLTPKREVALGRRN